MEGGITRSSQRCRRDADSHLIPFREAETPRFSGARHVAITVGPRYLVEAPKYRGPSEVTVRHTDRGRFIAGKVALIRVPSTNGLVWILKTPRSIRVRSRMLSSPTPSDASAIPAPSPVPLSATVNAMRSG